MTDYDSIFNSLPDAVMVLDSEDRVVTANLMLERLFNIDAARIIGMGLAELFPARKNSLAQVHGIPDGRIETHLNGRFVEMQLSPLKDANGSLQGRLVVLRDVTVSQAAKNVLLANERRYRALFENSNDGIFIIDFHLTILLANERAARMLNVQLDALVSASARTYFKPEQFGNLEKGIMNLLSGEPAPVYEQTLIRSDAVELPSEVSLTLVRDGNGEPLHIQAIVRDISERKLTERALNNRLEQLAVLRQVDEEISGSLHIDSVLLVALDAAMRLSRSDAGFIALGHAEEMHVTCLLGKYPATTQGMTIDQATGVVGRVMQTRRPELILDVKVDPDYRSDIVSTIAMMAIPLISQDTLVGMLNLETSRKDKYNEDNFGFVQILASRIAVAVDNARLYEYVRSQLSETQRLYSRVSSLEQMKTDMIRIASHDLKAPVALIEGYLELLKMDSELFDPMYLEFFEAMARACVRMGQMIGDILSLERIQERASGNTEILMNMSGMIFRAIEEFQPSLEAKSLTLLQQVNESIPALIHGDEAQLYEALVNLISNAIKYTPEGGTITISLLVERDDITFKVEDTGYGIPEDRQARLFEPFYRARAEGTENIEGTGLGLHLVKNVIERHSGKMLFSSEHGKGSMFGFTLPVAK